MPPPIQLLTLDDAEAAFRAALDDRDRRHMEAVTRAAAPLRFAPDWLHESDAADYLHISKVTLSKMRRGVGCDPVPFDTRTRNRQTFYRKEGPVTDGRGSLESYKSGEIGGDQD
jgi:hypothetical protein